MFAFAGPAYLVSVGYMDPGNWATDLEGGARFGYQLLWVLVMSNLMAILLQTLSARLGIVSGRDLAQACRETYPRGMTYALWIFGEIAIAACDLAEVLGAAIALNLLFHLPLLIGVIITAADTLLILVLQHYGIRTIEAFILGLITMMGLCFLVEILLAKPAFSEVITGLVPRLNHDSLYIAIGILGATVMPHNLYLHSALVQTRRVGSTIADRRVACRYNLIDSAVALNAALLVNAAILVMAAAVFYRNHVVVTQIQQAHQLLAPLLGSAAAGILFALALLCSGQSSTLTGTMAGQVVMEGFLNFRMRPWLRRLITRMLAITPAAFTIYLAGEQSTLQLIILSQVILSLQLPFAVIPLIHFTSDSRRMGEFANALWVRVLSWICAAIIVVLNAYLVEQTVGDWLAGSAHPVLIGAMFFPICAAVVVLLAAVTFEPVLSKRRLGQASVTMPEPATGEIEPPVYHRILVPLDHTRLDRLAVGHAAALARTHNSTLYLFHVEEGVTSQVYGSLSDTAEVEAGHEYLERIAASLRKDGINVVTEVTHSSDPKHEIVQYARRILPDLLVMGAHGHRRLKDLVFGNTINPVRHDLRIPILIVRDPG
jgi:manganese transport protein